MSDSLPKTREVQFGADGRLYELDGTPLVKTPAEVQAGRPQQSYVIGERAVCQSCRRPITFVGPYWDHDGPDQPRHPAAPVVLVVGGRQLAVTFPAPTPPAAAAGAGFVSPPVVACEDVDLESVERDALTHYYVAAGTVLGLVEMVRAAGAEVERLTARCEFLRKQWVYAAAIMHGDPETLNYSQAYRHVTEIVSAALADWDRGHPAGAAPGPPHAAPPDLEAAIRDAVDDLPSWGAVKILITGMGAEAYYRNYGDREWHEAESPDGLAAEVREAVEKCKQGPKDEDDDGEDDLPGPGPEPDPADEDEPAPSWPDRLRFDHDVSDSSPVVAGTKVTAAYVADMIVNGYTWESILRFHPELTEADVRACLSYAVEHEDEHEDATPEPSSDKADWVVTVRRTAVEKLHCPDCTREEAAGDPDGRSSRTEEVEDSEAVEVLGVARETGEDDDD